MMPATATPAAAGPIALDQVGGDVWAWEKRTTGSCAGVDADATIVLRVNDEMVEATREGDRFAATVRLRPGDNAITAIARAGGEEMSSPTVTHTVRLAPRPVARVAISVAGGQVTLDASGSEPSAYDDAPIRAYRWSVQGDGPATPMADDAPMTTIPIPADDGEYIVGVTVEDAAGRSDTGRAAFRVEEGVARAVDPLVEEAPWVESAVVYGMVVRAFTGGGFAGVVARLDELRDLGVTAIWFAPITRTVGDLFGYEVTDYFDVRESYGTLADFRALVDAAHARGMRVLMDFVPNHTSIEHPYFQDTMREGEASPYWDFYDRDAGGAYTYYFGWSHLPNLNYDNPEVRRFMTEAFGFWMREMDVDGFRVDVAWGITERRPDYWPEWSAELNRIKPDALLIAEASARDPFYVHHGFDAAYDWTDELGVWAWGEAFGGIAPISSGMTAALTNDGAGYDPDSLILRFLNNNDTGSRFITIYGPDFYRVSAAMLLTLPGLPCVYTGDEVGAEFLPYETLGEIDWSDRHELRPFFTRLIALRQEHPSLHSRAWRPLAVEPALDLFGYLRTGREGDPPIVVLLNFSKEPVEASVSLPDEVRAALSGDRLHDLWSDEPVAIGEGMPVTIPAWGLRLLTPPTEQP
ncbi:MAG TPA: alpha-amylase family glycosyl hydrolase [Thermomicrobiales bacterium]|nr:alpha-amylase family glycosyl hydrolase [Thermomicrobiales bacterium]